MQEHLEISARYAIDAIDCSTPACTNNPAVRFDEAYASHRAVDVAKQLRDCIDVLFSYVRNENNDSAFKVELFEWLRCDAFMLPIIARSESS